MDSKIEKMHLELPALKVTQPMGEFYVFTISAKDLLEVTFSEPLKYVDSSGRVQGSQRPKDNKRLKQIAEYIDSVEMAFPNSIILAANYTPNGNISKDDHERWKIEKNVECDIYKLKIPTRTKLAAIIDGQHRLNAFQFVTKEERFNDLQLICSVYFDLPNSYQAFLFATINSNQKKVDRSLALEQFGYNVEDEPEKAWTPEKFAVFLSRKLNLDERNSPFYQHVKVAPLNADKLFDGVFNSTWVVSTATIVDGICSLITSNPKRDRIKMQQISLFSGRNRYMIKEIKDVSPLRDFFLANRDQEIYDTIINYFKIIKATYWNNSVDNSYITKTVGVQACFDILKMILLKENSSNPKSINFKDYLNKTSSINFSDKFFQASGIGRSRIKNAIAISTGLILKEKIKKIDLPFYENILAGVNTNTAKDKMQWDEDAENAVLKTLENAEWNYESRTVSLLEDYDYEKILSFSSYEKFFQKLEEIAEIAFVSSLPSDAEFADQQREKFDVENLVQEYLNDYEENLKKIGWI